MFLCLPYVGINSCKIQRQLMHVLQAVSPCVSLHLVFKPTFKLSVLSRLKSHVPLLSRSGVVYRVNCNQCNAFYLGMTTRRLGQWMMKHGVTSSSAFYRHAEGHTVMFEEPSVLACDSNVERLYVKESLEITKLAAYRYINANTSSTNMKLW